MRHERGWREKIAARTARRLQANLRRAAEAEGRTSMADEATKMRKDAERYRFLRHGDNDERVMAFAENGDPYLPRNGDLDKAVDHWIAYDADEINHTVAAPAVGAA